METQVADFCIRHFYPHCAKSDENGSKTGNEDLHDESSKYARFFTEVARRTGHLVAEWTRVGFVHGVLNTDNMSILGDTIDYGPYGWLERFDPDFTPNTTDLPGKGVFVVSYRCFVYYFFGYEINFFVAGVQVEGTASELNQR